MGLTFGCKLGDIEKQTKVIILGNVNNSKTNKDYILTIYDNNNPNILIYNHENKDNQNIEHLKNKTIINNGDVWVMLEKMNFDFIRIINYDIFIKEEKEKRKKQFNIIQ